MSEKPISPLRQRMLEDMSMRRFTPDTQRVYGKYLRIAQVTGIIDIFTLTVRKHVSSGRQPRLTGARS